ncbi:MAG: hypothetical protein V4702_01955 [Patescibacteria group bacterium]
MFGLIPFFGGLIGIWKSGIWGGRNSSLGKSILFISIGLLLWGIGENIWSYYNIVKGIPAPYPSLADIGFAPSIFFWGLGAFYLSKASGARRSFRKSRFAKIFATVVSLILLAISYYMLVVVARNGVLVPPDEPLLKLILDIAYPLGDFIALTLAFVIFGLSFRLFGGHYSIPIMSILLGLITMYIGDFVFSYTTTVGTFYNGNWGDLILTTGLFFLTFGILGFASVPAAVGQRIHAKDA